MCMRPNRIHIGRTAVVETVFRSHLCDLLCNFGHIKWHDKSQSIVFNGTCLDLWLKGFLHHFDATWVPENVKLHQSCSISSRTSVNGALNTQFLSCGSLCDIVLTFSRTLWMAGPCLGYDWRGMGYGWHYLGQHPSKFMVTDTQEEGDSVALLVGQDLLHRFRKEYTIHADRQRQESLKKEKEVDTVQIRTSITHNYWLHCYILLIFDKGGGVTSPETRWFIHYLGLILHFYVHSSFSPPKVTMEALQCVEPTNPVFRSSIYTPRHTFGWEQEYRIQKPQGSSTIHELPWAIIVISCTVWDFGKCDFTVKLSVLHLPQFRKNSHLISPGGNAQRDQREEHASNWRYR